MRLYKITASNAQVSARDITKYVGSKAEGVATRKELYDRGFARKQVDEVEVDVPTDKAGLIEYLNKLVGEA